MENMNTVIRSCLKSTFTCFLVAEEYITNFLQFLREKFPDMTITPKLHMLEEHICPFLRQWHMGLGFTVVSIQSRFNTSRFDTNRSKFVTNVKSIRYKLTSLQIVSIQNTILERTQTSVVNKTNPYLREPPHVPKPPTQWEHVNETKFCFVLFIENRDLFKWFWDFFYNSSAYYA